MWRNYLLINNINKLFYKEEDINKKEYYSDNENKTYIPCNNSIENCIECQNSSYCNKYKNNYYFIGENRKECYKEIENEEIKKKYYTEDDGISYQLCNKSIINCDECINKTYCTKRDENYYFIGSDREKCVNTEITEKDKYYFDEKDNETYYPCDTNIVRCEKCTNKTYCIKS